jgi:copper(I)-binding protein
MAIGSVTVARMQRRAVATTAFLMTLVAACGGTRGGSLEITDSWAPSTPPNAETAAVYLTVENGTADGDRLISVESDACGSVELHATQLEDGIMRMRPASPDLLEIPSDGTLEMVPGGLHVMCIDPTEPFTTGGQVHLTAHFEKAGSLAITTPIENR